MTQSKCFKVAEQTFKEIQRQFPELTMTIDYNNKYLDLSMDILKQKGLDFNINLNLQNSDELHISTDYIWCQFFPADTESVVDIFFNSVRGLIKGEYRILQYVKNEKVYKAYLQRPYKDNWDVVYRHFHKIRLPWERLEKNIIQNKKPSRHIKFDS